jgi:hypothetical protein
MSETRVSDLTVDELLTLLQPVIRDAMREAMREFPSAKLTAERPPLDLPVVDVGPWPENLALRREEMYGDDER